MTDILGVAIVGCGAIAYNHANAIARMQELKIVALVDVDATSARSLAEHIDGHSGNRPAIYSSLSDALAAGVHAFFAEHGLIDIAFFYNRFGRRDSRFECLNSPGVIFPIIRPAFL